MGQSLRIKKIPERQCLGCNKHRPKRELIRVLRAPDGTVSLDVNGHSAGRGAYICPDLRCLARARKSGRLEHNLGCTISDEVYGDLEREVAARCENE